MLTPAYMEKLINPFSVEHKKAQTIFIVWAFLSGAWRPQAIT